METAVFRPSQEALNEMYCMKGMSKRAISLACLRGGNARGRQQKSKYAVRKPCGCCGRITSKPKGYLRYWSTRYPCRYILCDQCRYHGGSVNAALRKLPSFLSEVEVATVLNSGIGMCSEMKKAII